MIEQVQKDIADFHKVRRSLKLPRDYRVGVCSENITALNKQLRTLKAWSTALA